MKLRFLGTAYEGTPEMLTGADGPVVGKYRGAQWRTKQYAVASHHQSDVTLCYRGRAYHP